MENPLKSSPTHSHVNRSNEGYKSSSRFLLKYTSFVGWMQHCNFHNEGNVPEKQGGKWSRFHRLHRIWRHPARISERRPRNLEHSRPMAARWRDELKTSDCGKKNKTWLSTSQMRILLTPTNRRIFLSFFFFFLAKYCEIVSNTNEMPPHPEANPDNG